MYAPKRMVVDSNANDETHLLENDPCTWVQHESRTVPLGDGLARAMALATVEPGLWLQADVHVLCQYWLKHA